MKYYLIMLCHIMIMFFIFSCLYCVWTVAGETGQVCVFDLRSPNNAVLTYQEHSRAIHRIKFCITK